jgi:signal transduction histidine kinase
VPSTYEALPTYRLVTPAGVCRLPDGLDAHLMSMLGAIAEQEAENARLNAEEAAEEEAALEKERQRIAAEEAKRGQ